MTKTKIIRNSVKCLLCFDEIESVYRHDFKCCKCGNIAVDGGRDYLKRSGNWDKCEDTSIVEELCDT